MGQLWAKPPQTSNVSRTCRAALADPFSSPALLTPSTNSPCTLGVAACLQCWQRVRVPTRFTVAPTVPKQRVPTSACGPRGRRQLPLHVPLQGHPRQRAHSWGVLRWERDTSRAPRHMPPAAWARTFPIHGEIHRLLVFFTSCTSLQG